MGERQEREGIRIWVTIDQVAAVDIPEVKLLGPCPIATKKASCKGTVSGIVRVVAATPHFIPRSLHALLNDMANGVRVHWSSRGCEQGWCSCLNYAKAISN